MPKIRLIDSEVRKLAHGPTTWFSEERPNMHAGLRLCVGQSAKTFFLSKRCPHKGKVVSIKLGRFPALSTQAAWTMAQAEAARIDAGVVTVKTLPTLREMLERYITKQTRKGSLSEGTARDYRSHARNHLSDFLDLPLDKIDAVELTDHLEELRDLKPTSANKAAVVVGAVFKLADEFNLPVRSPVKAFDLAPQRKRLVDHSLHWAVRAAEIDTVQNVVKRTAWWLLWHTGIRSGNLRSLTWSDVDLVKNQVHLARMKNKLARTLPLSDTSVGLFKRLIGLDPVLVFPSQVQGTTIRHLDKLPSSTQHEFRHLWVTAAGLCHLPGYVIAFLKGDVVAVEGQAMVSHYMGDLGTHAAANLISAKIEEKIGLRLTNTSARY